MLIERCINNYFKETNLEEWKYSHFKKFMRIIGYTDDEFIIRNYLRFLKNILENEANVDKRKFIEKLIEKVERREMNEVNILYTDIPVFILFAAMMISIFDMLALLYSTIASGMLRNCPIRSIASG